MNRQTQVARNMRAGQAMLNPQPITAGPAPVNGCMFPPATPYPPVPLYFNRPFADDFVEDRYDFPIPGPQGPQGLPGIPGRVINQSGQFSVTGQTINAGASNIPISLGTLISNGVSLSGNQLSFATPGLYLITLTINTQGTGGNAQLMINSSSITSSPVYIAVSGTQQLTGSASFIVQVSTGTAVSFTVSNTGAAAANVISGIVSAALVAPL